MVKKMHSSSNGTTGTNRTAKAAPSPKGRKAGEGQQDFLGLQNSALAASVKDSAQQIWLAGMGAFSKAQEEGTKVFESLVKEGQSLQRKTQAVAEEKIGEVTGKMTAMADSVSSKAGQNWDKLESIFEARTAKAMNKLGVPTAKDVAALTQRVDELAQAVAKLSRSGARAAAPAKAPKAAAEAEAKTARKTTGKRAQKADAASAAAAPAATKTAARRARKTAAAAPAAAA